jgi:hypothetical protein
VLSYFYLVSLYTAAILQDVEPELAAPARTPEQLAHRAMIFVDTTGLCRITGRPAKPAYQDLVPPADRAKEAGRDEMLWVAIGIPGPDVGQRGQLPFIKFSHSSPYSNIVDMELRCCAS